MAEQPSSKNYGVYGTITTANYAGKKIELFKEGEMFGSLSSDRMNEILRAINALLDIKVTRTGSIPKSAIYSDANVTIPIPTNLNDFDELHPFQIYETGDGATAGSKKFKVNGGNAIVTCIPDQPGGAAGFVSFQQNPTVALEGTDVEFTSLDGVVTYVWASLIFDVGDGTYHLKLFAGNNPSVAAPAADTSYTNWIDPGGASNSPQIDGFHFPIAYFQVVSGEVFKSQFVRQDFQMIVTEFHDGSGPFTNRNILINEGSYSGSSSYSPQQSMVYGTTGQGFPANGLYLYIGSGGVGPSSAWRAF